MRQFPFVGFVLAIALLVATRAEALVNGIDISAYQGNISAATLAADQGLGRTVRIRSSQPGQLLRP